MDAAKQVLTQVSGLEADSPLTQLILPVYGKILGGASAEDLRRTADALKAASLGAII